MPSPAPDPGAESDRFLRRLTLWHIALLLPWVVAVASSFRKFNDNSYLWHVRAGEHQIELGRVLTADPFSFTAGGESWRTQSWLAELLYSRLDVWMGLEGPRLMTTVLAMILFMLLGLGAYRWSRSVPSVALYLVASSIVVAGFLVPRPVIFSFPLMAAVVVADDDDRLKWTLPLLMWIWASVHGSFAVGLAYLGLRAIGRGLTKGSFARLTIVGLATLVTAHGIGVLQIVLDFVGNRKALGYMSEWATPDLISFPLLPLFAGILILIWLGSRGRMRSSDAWILIPFLALALSANRAIPPAWLALAPIVGRARLPWELRSRISWKIAGVVGFVVLTLPLLLPFERVLDTERFPVEAAKHLETEYIFHDDATGGWLIYTQWPQRQVFIDDRAELYSERIGQFSDIRAARADWQGVFQRYEIEEALLPQGTPLGRLLVAEGWRVTYEDEAFEVLLKG